MLNLLRADRIKLQGGRKLWVILGLFIFLPLFQLVNTISKAHYQGALILKVDQVINGATSVLMPLKTNLLVLLIFCSFVSFYIGEEFQNGTIRNALSLGVSRTKYYLTKLLVAFVLTLIAIVLVTGVSILGFTGYFGFGEFQGIPNYSTYFWQISGVLFCLIFSVVAVYVAISFITQSIGSGMIWSFVYTIAMGFLPGVFQNFDFLKPFTWWFSESYLFYTNFTNVQVLETVPKMFTVSILTVIIVSIIGYWCFLKSDLK